MAIIRLVARPLLAAPFIVDGWSAVRHPDSHVERIQPVRPLLHQVGVDLSDQQLRLATRVSGLVTVAAGTSLALGIGQRGAATVLAATSLPLALANNPVWTARSREDARTTADGLRRSLAVVAGLFFAAADRRGKPSASWRLRNRREHRAQIKATKSAAWEDARRAYGA